MAGCYIFHLSACGGRSAIIRGIFGAGSGFRVGWHSAGEFSFCFSRIFCYYWRDVYFWGGGAVHGAFILWGLDTFLLSPNFLRSYVLSHSASRIYYVYK